MMFQVLHSTRLILCTYCTSNHGPTQCIHVFPMCTGQGLSYLLKSLISCPKRDIKCFPGKDSSSLLVSNFCVNTRGILLKILLLFIERLRNLRTIGTPVFSQIACGVNFTHMDCRLRSLQQLDLLVGELVKIAG